MHIPPDDVDAYIIGSKLKARQAKSLIRTTYAETVEGRQERIKLLSYFMHNSLRGPKQAELYSHELIKFISEKPGDPAHQLLSFPADSEYFARCKECWLHQVNLNDTNTAVLENAASFFSVKDPVTAERLYLQAILIEPTNHSLTFALCWLHLAHAANVPERRRRVEKMCDILQNSVAKFDLTDANLVSQLHEMAERSYEFAESSEQQSALDIIINQLKNLLPKKPPLKILSPEFFKNLGQHQ